MEYERVLESLSNRLLDLDSIIENNGDNLAEPDTYEFVNAQNNENTKKKQYRTFSLFQRW